MNKLVYSGLALTLVSASAFATDTGWVSLDQEINSLNASLSAQNTTGPKITGWVRSRWQASSDVQVPLPTTGTEDLQGFSLDNVRIELTGDAGSDYSYKVSFDFAGVAGAQTAVLKDAYAKFKIGDSVTGKLGQFKTNFLRSATVADNKLVLLDRTALGSLFSARDIGIEFAGTFDTIGWSLSAQNGSDGTAKDYLFAAKVSANLMGGGVGPTEGAFGAGDGTALTAGISYMDDGFPDDSTRIGGEIALTASSFSIHGEVVDFDKGVAGPAAIGVVGEADTTPWDVTGSYLFNDNWEAVVRYQDYDNTSSTTNWAVGVNYYVSGHNIKWTADWKQQSDDNISDISIVELGLSVSL